MKIASFIFFLLSFLALGALQGNPVSPAWASSGAKKSEGESEEKPERKKGDDISGGRFEGDPIYVHIQPMVLPIINEEGIQQLVSLILSVHVKDLETANILHRNMPRVTDALLRHLYGGLDEGSLRKGKVVNVGKVKIKAAEAISEIVDKKNILDILVEGISQRML